MEDTVQEEAAVEEAPVEEAKPKKPKVVLEERNGVRKPRAVNGAGNVPATRRVWDIADALAQQNGEPPTVAQVREQGLAEGLNNATISTQFARWRKYWGVESTRKKATKEPDAGGEPEATTDSAEAE